MMMDQLSLFAQPQTPYTVTEINAYLRDLMESDRVLQDLWVQGEVSNLSRPKSGHMYFTIKDSQAALRCVMWRNQVAALSYLPQDGDAVEVRQFCESLDGYRSVAALVGADDNSLPATLGLLLDTVQGETLLGTDGAESGAQRPCVVGGHAVMVTERDIIRQAGTPNRCRSSP